MVGSRLQHHATKDLGAPFGTSSRFQASAWLTRFRRVKARLVEAASSAERKVRRELQLVHRKEVTREHALRTQCQDRDVSNGSFGAGQCWSGLLPRSQPAFAPAPTA
jgi:hypothetical protein